jgi:hypothetical protein
MLVNAYDYISMRERGGPTLLGQIMSQFLIGLIEVLLPPRALIALAAQLVMMGGCFVLSLYLTNNLQAKFFVNLGFFVFGDLRTCNKF